MMGQQPAALPAKNPYQVGTLVYTKMGLVSVFFWILWGDFCFQLMETVAPALVPLMLKDAGASNLWIGLIVGTIPAILNGVVCAIVSFLSDLRPGPIALSEHPTPALPFPNPAVHG